MASDRDCGLQVRTCPDGGLWQGLKKEREGNLVPIQYSSTPVRRRAVGLMRVGASNMPPAEDGGKGSGLLLEARESDSEIKQ